MTAFRRNWSAFVLKALAKRPSERYTTAKDMADDLHRLTCQTESFSAADLKRLVERVVEEKLRQAIQTGTPNPLRPA